MCEMIDDQVATLLLLIIIVLVIIIIILVIMVGAQAAQRGRWRSLVSERAGQQRERSTVDTGDYVITIMMMIMLMVMMFLMLMVMTR